MLVNNVSYKYDYDTDSFWRKQYWYMYTKSVNFLSCIRGLPARCDGVLVLISMLRYTRVVSRVSIIELASHDI